MLTKIKLLLGISGTSKDALLDQLIDNAEEFAVNFTNNPEALGHLSGAITLMVLHDYNRIGSEGVASENYSGASFTYLSEYPEGIMKQLRQYRKVKVI